MYPIEISRSNQYKNSLWFNRIALFVVFFWFGILKVLGFSPAKELVTNLHHLTLEPFVNIHVFLPFLGYFECLIGLLWLIPKFTKLTFYIFCIQMITTFLPLFLLKSEMWQHGFGLSLAGQYIVKNIVLVAAAFSIFYQRN